MKQILGRFLTQENRDFPIDCETFDYLQVNMAMLAILGNIAGNKAILQGCQLSLNNTRREAGYVFLKTNDFPDGEILYWEGGSISSGMYLKQEVLSVTDKGTEYPQAYVVRSLAPGIGLENYSWSGFRSIRTNRQLEDYDAEQDKAIQQLAPPPLGIVQMWAGKIVPEGYELCEGQQLRITAYPDLYAAIGSTFNTSRDYNGNQFLTTAGYFRLPDLRGRFIVGYNTNDADYSKYGIVGGKKKHALTVSEMPSHNHSYNAPLSSGSHPGGSGGYSRPNNVETGTTAATGGGQAHESRPPYYTLAYIMRVK